MIIYRPHRGSLVDAMMEAKEFDNIDDMKTYIVKQWNNWFSEEDIIIDDEIMNDDRNGWKDTRYVCTKRFGEQTYRYPQCIGMCATDYPKL